MTNSPIKKGLSTISSFFKMTCADVSMWGTSLPNLVLFVSRTHALLLNLASVTAYSLNCIYICCTRYLISLPAVLWTNLSSVFVPYLSTYMQLLRPRRSSLPSHETL